MGYRQNCGVCHTDRTLAVTLICRAGYEACQAVGERGQYLVGLAVLLADAVYEQGRFDEAQQLIEPGRRGTPSPRRGSAWLIEAKLLARRGQFAAARQLIGRAQAIPSWTTGSPSGRPMHSRPGPKGGATRRRTPDQAAACLRAALHIYEDFQAATQARRTRAALASLAAQPERRRRAGLTTRLPVQHDHNRPFNPLR